jgi:hypothetical protein
VPDVTGRGESFCDKAAATNVSVEIIERLKK